MAIIYANNTGEIIRFFQDRINEGLGGVPPDYTYILEFDSSTNQIVINNLIYDWNSHDLIDGILHRNGIPVIINPPSEEYQAIKTLEIEFPQLPDWVKSGTAAQAETYLTGQIFNGMNQAEVETWIDTNITNITTANVSQINTRLGAIRQGLKLVAGAIITMRGFFVITAKLLIYIRDLVIRFREL